MKTEELKEFLFKKYTYINNDHELVYDWCDNCGRPVEQTEFQGCWGCEYCGSENINIRKVEQ